SDLPEEESSETHRLSMNQFRFQMQNNRSIINRANPHRRLVRTTALIGITLLCEIIFVAIPDFFLNFNLFGLKKYEMIWYLIVLSKGIVNIFLYSLHHEDIKAVLLSHVPSGWKARIARVITVRESTVRGENSHNAHRTVATTLRTSTMAE
ncbi:hypothetical protein PMAYCL1PPCAC_07777, partial [Pristionchus mayeri]